MKQKFVPVLRKLCGRRNMEIGMVLVHTENECMKQSCFKPNINIKFLNKYITLP